jgi:hypothetical protein
MDSEYRFQYWEKLGKVRLKRSNQADGIEIPLYLGFNPLASFPSLLGTGWSLAIFESRIEWRNSNTAELYLPDGQTETLERMGDNKRRIKGSGWIAQISGRQVTCKASCGWTLVFLDNRLVSMKAPDGTSFEIAVGADRTHRLLSGTNTLVTLKPDFDPRTTLKIFHLQFAGQSLLFRMGKRPVFKQEQGKQEKVVHVESLVGIENNNISTKPGFSEENGTTLEDLEFRELPLFGKFDFKQNEVLAKGHLYRWDPKTGDLKASGGTKYDFITIRGIRCFRESVFPGIYSLKGGAGHTEILQEYGGPLTLIERFPWVPGEPDYRLRKVSHILPNGELKTMRQVWYDEDGNILKLFYIGNKGRPLLLLFEENQVTVRDEETKTTIGVGKYKENRLESWTARKKKYAFTYDAESKTVTIRLDGSQKIRSIPEEDFLNLFGHWAFPALSGGSPVIRTKTRQP